MTSPGFDSGGFLASDTEIGADFSTVAMTLDNRPMEQVSGTWDASGTKASTATARGSDPKLILRDAPFSDFDFSVDVGHGDALYLRYVDASNWLRVSQYQTYSTSSYQCNPYACNPYACNPYACNPYACNPYACNPYACNPYACNPYACNCADTYAPASTHRASKDCLHASGAYAFTYICDGCGSGCCGLPGCPNGSSGGTNFQCYYTGSNNCTVYAGQSCQTCYSTCFQTCFQTCYDTCFQTCFQTCYDTCFQTCTDYLYPTALRLEKMVGGTLTNVIEANLGTTYGLGTNADARVTRIRAVGKGSNIKVFTNRSTSTPAINTTVADFVGARRFGVGRIGYGNQDTGNTLDNLVLKNA